MTKSDNPTKTRMRGEVVEATRMLNKHGVVSDSDLHKTTMRMLGPDALPGAAELAGRDILSIREGAQMSQAVFARLLDVSPGTLSKWERDELKPRGPARRLLQVIRDKGVDVIM